MEDLAVAVEFAHQAHLQKGNLLVEFLASMGDWCYNWNRKGPKGRRILEVERMGASPHFPRRLSYWLGNLVVELLNLVVQRGFLRKDRQ